MSATPDVTVILPSENIQVSLPCMHVPYPCERRPMGGEPYIGPRLGDGPIFEVSASRLYSKERPGKLPMLAS